MITQTINIAEINMPISQLLEEVEKGSEIIFARGGRPIAKLSKIKQKPKIKFGVLKGKVKVSDNFDDPLPDEILSEFESQ